MGQQTFRVVLEGKTLRGQETGLVASNLGRLFRQPAEQLVSLLQGNPLVVKRGLDEATALRYLSAVQQAGAACRLEVEHLDVDLPSPVVATSVTPARQPQSRHSGSEGEPNTPPPPSSIMTSERRWYYEDAGSQIGPLAKSAVEDLINKKQIVADTLVWPGHGEWITAAKSELSSSLEPGVPPLPSTNVDNSYVWAIVATPLVGAMIEMTIGSANLNPFLVFLAYFVANGVLCVLDATRLKAAGHKAPAIAWLILIPVYLWMRASILKHRPSYFWGWLVALALSFVLNPAANPFGKALVKINCQGTGFDTVQCAFSNEGSAPGTLCVDVVLVCADGRHLSHVCSSSIAPGGADSKVLNQWSPPLQLLSICGGIEYDRMKVTVP